MFFKEDWWILLSTNKCVFSPIFVQNLDVCEEIENPPSVRMPSPIIISDDEVDMSIAGDGLYLGMYVSIRHPKKYLIN